MKLTQWVPEYETEPIQQYNGYIVPSAASYASTEEPAEVSSYDVTLYAENSYGQYSSSPAGLSYLVGDILPWQDYVVFRTDEDTSVAVYSNKSENLTFEDATVRTVKRTSSSYSSYYTTTEEKYDTVTVSITSPYYAYGNVIGVHYALPSSQNISSLFVSVSFVIVALLSVFRLLWSLRRLLKR